MSDTTNVDICVIGAGSGGLSVAAGAVQMGASVALIEKGAMGGDCLNYGCVPSKALLAAGHAADAVRKASRFGMTSDGLKVDAAGVYGHVRRTIEAIEPHDSVERFEGLGVQVFQAAGRFVSPGEVDAGGARIRFRRAVIATGSRAFVPSIPGIESVPYLTNETIFSQTQLPDHLIVIGGGPIGVELAQAHRHLGCEVTVLEMSQIMPKDDPDLVTVVRAELVNDGIRLLEGVNVTVVEKIADGVSATVVHDGVEETIKGTHLLVAAGRRANVGGMNMEAAGVDCTSAGIPVDKRLRTSNKKIFAIGDVVAGGYQFTHVAGDQAGTVIRNVLFRLPAKVRQAPVPWVTYTSPELAQVGLTEARAKEQNVPHRLLTAAFADNDRARAEGKTEGQLKAVVDAKGRILGCGIVGAGAGELIQPWVLAMENGMKIGKLASTMVAYPTLSEISKRAAGSFYTGALFSDRTKAIVRFLARFG